MQSLAILILSHDHMCVYLCSLVIGQYLASCDAVFYCLRFRMYIWNNIFFSLASDGRDHYKEFGGDEAAHAAAVSQ